MLNYHYHRNIFIRDEILSYSYTGTLAAISINMLFFSNLFLQNNK